MAVAWLGKEEEIERKKKGADRGGRVAEVANGELGKFQF